MKNTLKIATLFLFVLSNFANAQGPWTREKNKAYLQLGLTNLSYDLQRLNDKNIDLGRDYSDITTQIYSEYGITNKLEAQLVLPFKIVSYKNQIGNGSNNLSGIGNVTLGLKYKLYDNKWKISSGLQFVANSITKNSSKGLTTGFNANAFLPYIAAGSSSGKWYYFANVGYGYMDNDYSDFMKITAEVGYNVINKGHIMLVLDNRILASKENAFLNDSNQWPSYIDRQEYNAVGLKLNYELIKDKFGANFAGIGAFNFNYAPAAPTLNFGVYAKL